MKEKVFSCAICGKEAKLRPGEKVPNCCGRPMTLKLNKCTTPFVAETARPDAADDPCDDGTDTDK
jgi:hypothetical protein